ncbi:hypothetical protein [Pajaroellobacter abortibovis]|uniref:hypothetical protein n=1 Tax=Pajaroellobacter abortibovis TaxID=1882918 RepID=UPI0012EB6FFE|nr:hypothetical protein [Pajaroellobacter abortibovis]
MANESIESGHSIKIRLIWQTTVKELMVYHLDKEQKGIDSEETRKLLAAFPNLEVVRISLDGDIP